MGYGSWLSVDPIHSPCRNSYKPSEFFSNLRKKRLRLHSFGPLLTIATENQWEITEIGCLSCFSEFCVRFHIVCDKYSSDYAHFTFSNTI